jgi:hypothetical protein
LRAVCRFSPFFIQFPTVIRPFTNRLCPFFTVFTVFEFSGEKYFFREENAGNSAIFGNLREIGCAIIGGFHPPSDLLKRQASRAIYPRKKNPPAFLARVVQEGC